MRNIGKELAELAIAFETYAAMRAEQVKGLGACWKIAKEFCEIHKISMEQLEVGLREVQSRA